MTDRCTLPGIRRRQGCGDHAFLRRRHPGSRGAAAEDGRAGAGDELAAGARMPAFGSNTNCTSTGACQKSRAISAMRPENWLLTQSSLKRFGAAMLSVFAAASKATGANGLIHVTYCWGVSSRSSNAEQCCQKSFIELLSLWCARRFAAAPVACAQQGPQQPGVAAPGACATRVCGASEPERRAGFLGSRTRFYRQNNQERELSTGTDQTFASGPACGIHR